MSGGPPGQMSAPQSHPDSQSTPSQASWEGDKMFNIYIYDYCTKRGFSKTARELQHEADIPPDSSPPIDAKQGLLFEWWSVFWVLFTAKNNGTGTEDALVYTQMQQVNMRGIRPTPQVSRMMNGNPGPIPNGAQGPMPYPMPASGPQPNGIPIPSGAPTPAGANPSQPQNFPQLGQRPAAPQHRGPNGVNPYQSPTMAHSPQNPATNPIPNPQHPQPPMGQLGPSPHMSQMAQGRMLPPGANMGAVSSAQASQFGRSPSRPGTPGQSMIQRSPSLINRQPPPNPREISINNELNALPRDILAIARQDAGLGDKDMQSLSVEEKRLSTMGLTQTGRKPGLGPHGLPGPSNPGQGMPLQGQRPPGQLPQQPQLPPQQTRVVKRNSTSPPDEGSLPNNESSPPDRKRVRRSSVTMDQPPPIQQYPHPQPQPQLGSVGQPMPNAGMAGNSMNIQMGAPPIGGGMAPGMGSQPGMMMAQQVQYRQNMHMPKTMAPGTLGPNMLGEGTPAPGDPAINPGQALPGAFPGPQNNRTVQNKQPMNMPPPPSPAGGPPKEQPKDGNKPPGAPNGVGHPDGSPQNQPPNPPQAGGQGPPTASNTQGSTAPPTPSATQSSFTGSPSGVNGTPTLNPAVQPTSTSLPEIPSNFLTNDFMQSVSSLEDFDPQAFFRQDGAGINFEQEFREWFSPEGTEGMRND
ncbi:hypothetical protein V8B97DRAFT_271670 [Scleroderma yunnanense]